VLPADLQRQFPAGLQLARKLFSNQSFQVKLTRSGWRPGSRAGIRSSRGSCNRRTRELPWWQTLFTRWALRFLPATMLVSSPRIQSLFSLAQLYWQPRARRSIQRQVISFVADILTYTSSALPPAGTLTVVLQADGGGNRSGFRTGGFRQRDIGSVAGTVPDLPLWFLGVSVF